MPEWTENPASPPYPGITRLRVGDRTIAAVGTGPHVRAVIEQYVNQIPGSASVARRPAARTKSAAGQPK